MSETLVGDAALLVDGALAARLEGRDLPASLVEAMAYASLDGGKRLRPALVFASCDAVGGTREDVVSCALAVELVHAFSLVHDDLPALDDDDLRRGRATVHVRFGEAMAILAGDALLAEAFAIVLEDDGVSKAVVRELADATEQMIGGQVCDSFPLEAGEGVSRVAHLEMIHRRKTGALIRASCRMGAMVGGASESDLERITSYGEAIGLMYQVVDDLLDVEQTSERAGKRTGKDATAGKLTYPGELGVEGARERVGELHRESLGAIGALGERARGLVALSEMMVSRTS
ncbi:MAG: polyprenyl synthetase family protein [Phycisphaerales bacterium JB043]